MLTLNRSNQFQHANPTIEHISFRLNIYNMKQLTRIDSSYIHRRFHRLHQYLNILFDLLIIRLFHQYFLQQKRKQNIFSIHILNFTYQMFMDLFELKIC